MPETMVRCHNLHKSFAETSILQNVTFSVATGQILTLLGPSGCGKTTTLRVIAGFESLDEGWIEVAGRTVADSRLHMPPEKRRVGMVFQDYAIFPHLSVGENVRFGLGRGKGAQARALEMLALVGLADAFEKMPHELSGGQQQRVALARALVMEPAVLLLDEPFSNLDHRLRLQMRVEVKALLKEAGATAIFVTHDQEEALFMGDKVAVMNGGQVEQLGVPEVIFHEPRTRFVASFIGQSDFLPGRVTSLGIETQVGLLKQPVPWQEGQPVDILLRPDDIDFTPHPHGNAHILERHFIGLTYLYRLVLADGTIVHSQQPHTTQISQNTPVQITFVGDHPLATFLKS